MAERLIITNGDLAVERLQAADVDADFLPWRDALYDGPVPGGLLLEALSLIRAQYLARDLGLPLAEVSRQFAERNAKVRNLGSYERVELWFEHDLYDQLQLIEILDFFRTEERTEGLFLVQADDYLATLPPAALAALAQRAIPIGPAHRETGAHAWAAFTAATPERLAGQAAHASLALPHLAAALARLLQELPAVTSGLSLTEERILKALAEGARTPSELFQETQAQEAARFFGDTAFFRQIDRLAFAPHPLIAGLAAPSAPRAEAEDRSGNRSHAATPVRITERGRATLAGRFDHAVENAIERWLGGTHITPKTMWRRDRDGRLALPPVG